MRNGLITKATHDRVIRFAPALVITEPEINAAMEIVEKSLHEFDEVLKR